MNQLSASYIETDCTVEHGGRTFTANGAVVTPDWVIGYLAKDGVLTDWHGRPIGTWRALSTWRTPKSYVSSTMSQVEAVAHGVLYTGRSAGVGMIYKGRRKGSRVRK